MSTRFAEWGHWGITFWVGDRSERPQCVAEIRFAVGGSGPIDGTIGSAERERYQAIVRAWCEAAELPEGAMCDLSSRCEALRSAGYFVAEPPRKDGYRIESRRCGTQSLDHYAGVDTVLRQDLAEGKALLWRAFRPDGSPVHSPSCAFRSREAAEKAIQKDLEQKD